MYVNGYVIYLLTISNANSVMFNVSTINCALFNLQIYFQGETRPLIGICKSYMLCESAGYFRVYTEVFQELFIIFKELALYCYVVECVADNKYL